MLSNFQKFLCEIKPNPDSKFCVGIESIKPAEQSFPTFYLGYIEFNYFSDAEKR